MNTPLSIGLGRFALTETRHVGINDGLKAVFRSDEPRGIAPRGAEDGSIEVDDDAARSLRHCGAVQLRLRCPG